MTVYILTPEQHKQAVDALARSYNVADWPANGKTDQDAALAMLESIQPALPTQPDHGDLIRRLRSAAVNGPIPCPVCNEAADALEGKTVVRPETAGLTDEQITVIGNNYSNRDGDMTWDVWPVFARAILTADKVAV